MRAQRPSIARSIVKLNEGVSGAGNAVVRPRRPAGARLADERGHGDATAARTMELESQSTPFDAYVAKFAKHGGIVEERITGDRAGRVRACRCGCCRTATVELLSTHDQLLGGASGQKYLGCVFPANPEYARRSPSDADGDRAAPGASRACSAGSRSISLSCRTTRGEWTPYAIELNLRKGGTTHPFLTLQFLTDGSYDAETALFIDAARPARSTWSRPTTSSRRPAAG